MNQPVRFSYDVREYVHKDVDELLLVKVDVYDDRMFGVSYPLIELQKSQMACG